MITNAEIRTSISALIELPENSIDVEIIFPAMLGIITVKMIDELDASTCQALTQSIKELDALKSYRIRIEWLDANGDTKYLKTAGGAEDVNI